MGTRREEEPIPAWCEGYLAGQLPEPRKVLLKGWHRQDPQGGPCSEQRGHSGRGCTQRGQRLGRGRCKSSSPAFVPQTFCQGAPQAGSGLLCCAEFFSRSSSHDTYNYLQMHSSVAFSGVTMLCNRHPSSPQEDRPCPSSRHCLPW